MGPDPAPLPRSRPERLGLAVPTALGAALVGLAGLQAVLAPLVRLVNVPDGGWQGTLAGLGALLLCARYPLLGWRVGYGFAFLVPLLPDEPPPVGEAQLILVLLVFGLAGWRHSRAALWWMWAFMLAPFWLSVGPVQRVAPVFEAQRALSGVSQGVASVALTALTVALDATAAWQQARRALAAESERAELQGARRAVLEERARIAREMHDVVAHHMSLIAVQAETARYRRPGLSAEAVEELGSVSAQAREALSDMRRLLGLLRSDAPAELTPQPGFGDVPALVATSRRAGVAVELSVREPAGLIPPGVGLCAYRVLQEALSNAARHAPGSAVSVKLDGTGEALQIEVTNGPAAARAPFVPPHTGQGLAGMRERVTLLGGCFSAGPTREGGFRLSADLPLGSALGAPLP